MASGDQIPVYISGASAEAPRVRMWAAQLARTGIVRFVDPWWTTDPEGWTGRDAYRSREEQASISAQHKRAIRESRIVWMLAPHGNSRGANAEWGYASALADLLGERGPILCASGSQSAASVFYADAVYRDPVDALGCDFVCRIARELSGKAVRT